MSLIDIHGRLANTVMFYVVIMALWGLWRYFRKQGVEGSYWGALVIAEILLVLQALLGVTLWATGQGSLEGRWIHVLYGVVSVISIPFAFTLTKGEQDRRSMLVYGAFFLFLIGIVLRAISTGGA